MGKTMETVTDFTFWGSKITADGDCSSETKGCLLLGRKVMTNLDSILAWKIPWTEEPGRLQSMGSRSWTRLSDFTFNFHFPLSCIREGNGNPLQCSLLENPRDGGPWWAAVSGVAQSRTRLKRLSSSSSSSWIMYVKSLTCS